MSKQARINLALLAVIVILVLVSMTTSDEADTPDAARQVSAIDPSTITAISITRKGKPALVFSKENESWTMQAPLQLRVNMARINAILRLLNVESYGELDPAQVELARFNLDDPVITLQLNEHVFKFGNTDGIDQRRYLLFNDTIFMLNDFLYAQLDANPGFFADTRLIPEDKTITALTFPDNRFELVEGKWQMQKLVDIKPQQLPELASAWQQAEAISVSSLQEAQQEVPIIITTADNVNMAFYVIATTPHLVLGRKDLLIQYHMGSDDAARLLLQEPAPDNTTP